MLALSSYILYMGRSLLLFFLAFTLISCQDDRNILHEIIDSDPLLMEMVKNKSVSNILIRYTRIGSDEIGTHKFRHFSYQDCEECHFNPGNSIRLPVTLLALEQFGSSKGHFSDIKRDIETIFSPGKCHQWGL